jgi:hypothetical protein
VVQNIPCAEKLFIGGYLNGHVGSDRIRFENAHGGQGKKAFSWDNIYTQLVNHFFFFFVKAAFGVSWNALKIPRCRVFEIKVSRATWKLYK